MQRFTKKRPRRRAMDSVANVAADTNFDPVTGLAMRDMFRERAEGEWQRRCKDHGPMTVLLVDIDRFDAYKGVEGAEAADECLNLVAEIISARCRRRGDFAARMRDHNFALLLSEAVPKGAEKIGEGIRQAVENLGLGNMAARTRITASVSVAVTIPKSNRFVDSIIKLADQGLGEACDRGGNCVISVRDQ